MKRIALILVLSALAANAADSTSVASSRLEHRARMQNAISARDYDAWKAERDSWGARGLAGQKVTRENFETFARMHDAMVAGRTEEASALRRQLGLDQTRMGRGMGNGQGKGAGRGMGAGNGNGMGMGGGQGCPRAK